MESVFLSKYQMFRRLAATNLNDSRHYRQLGLRDAAEWSEGRAGAYKLSAESMANVLENYYGYNCYNGRLTK